MSRSVDSLDSVSVASDTSYAADDDELAEQEWRESLGQLQQLFSVVLMPIFGRWLGRKWSFWAYARYIRVGLGKSFFLGDLSPVNAS